VVTSYPGLLAYRELDDAIIAPSCVLKQSACCWRSGGFGPPLLNARGNDSYCDLLRLNHKFSEDFDAETLSSRASRSHRDLTTVSRKEFMLDASHGGRF